ncbi:MAG: GIY-YIG nuclease family protein [Cyclobacteriaceae bacterium]
MYFIYILYSTGYDKFYVGYSNDPFRRLMEHNNAAAKHLHLNTVPGN